MSHFFWDRELKDKFALRDGRIYQWVAERWQYYASNYQPPIWR